MNDVTAPMVRSSPVLKHEPSAADGADMVSRARPRLGSRPVRGARAIRGARAVSAALAAAVVIVAPWPRAPSPPPVPAPQQPSAAAPAVTVAPTPVPTLAAPGRPALQTLVPRRRCARCRCSTRPGAPKASVVLDNRKNYSGRTVFVVIGHQPGWYKVLVPRRPNGRVGWVKANEIGLFTTEYSINVSLSRP